MKRVLGVVLMVMPMLLASEVGKRLVFDPLPYDTGALEPHIDSQTMEIHFNRHHKAYFENLQKAVSGTPLAELPIEGILAQVSKWPDAVRNNAGGHWNHSAFWKMMAPDGGGQPKGELARKIDAVFGSYTGFQEQFKKAGLSHFGSGWVWLVLGPDGSLFISTTSNQDNPLMDTAKRPGYPLLALDLWEHAYYLKYQNLRGNYIDAFWHVVNWREAESRFKVVGSN